MDPIYLCEIYFVQVVFACCINNDFIVPNLYKAFIEVKLVFQIVWHKFTHEKQIGMKIGHVEHIFNTKFS